MAILWLGGEDLDFTGGSARIAHTSAGTFRPTYARCAVISSNTGVPMWSNSFPGGAVTSCWVTMEVAYNDNNTFSTLHCGLVSVASGNGSGLYVGTRSSVSPLTLGLFTYDGATATQLAAGAFPIWLNNTNLLKRFDIQLISYGATATVNIYVAGSLNLTFTGDVRIGGLTTIDAVAVVRGGNVPTVANGYSEIIVADEDTRAFVGLATLVPTSAGTTDDWTGAYTDVNEITIDDATMVYTSTAAKDEQFNITNPLAGNYRVKAVGVVARATSTLAAAVNSVALGFNNAGTVAVGAPHLTTTAWTSELEIFAQDPTTSADWLLADMNALQVDLQSS